MSHGRVVDMTGAKVGSLTVLGREGYLGAHAAWLCQCECGGTKVVRGTHLKRNLVTRCDLCSNRSPDHGKKKSRPPVEDIVGQMFGVLRVIEWAGYVKEKSSWRCRCECLCGCQKEGVWSGVQLRSGDVKSCGCCAHKATIAAITTHGEGRRGLVTPEYQTWVSIKARCFNENNPNYPRYGGRGITMCREWDESYEAFLADVGRRPTSQHTIERIDNNGNYEPGNVRWATREEQANNRRSNRLLAAFGQKKTVSQWSKEYGVNRTTIENRIEYGMSVEEALTKPVRPY